MVPCGLATVLQQMAAPKLLSAVLHLSVVLLRAVVAMHADTCLTQLRGRAHTVRLQELVTGAETHSVACSGRLLQAVSAAVAQLDVALRADDTDEDHLNQLVWLAQA